MRINITNKAGINVDKNFEISYQNAVDISSKIHSHLSNTEKITPGGIYAINIMGQIYKYLFINYLIKENPDIISKTEKYINETTGVSNSKKVKGIFTKIFPPEGNTIEELIILRLTNENPACAPYSIIFDETELKTKTAYIEILKNIYSFLKSFKGPGKESQNFIDFLKEPVKAHPSSLIDQLDYISKNWKLLLGDKFQLLLRGMDFLKEEHKAHFPPGPGPSEIYTYDYSDGSPEGFSKDSNWMPNVVMIAKSTLVWLDQLSKQYKLSITKLDQIPDRELDILSERGFSALWLIGLWERSSASKQIKRTCGNPEAESSAYSLKRYEIADELGGWQALTNLKQRCNERGIRLASDMVPNHTGIDSDWINEHPDWFLQLPCSPYPNYSFNGQNLSTNPNIGIYIEDHYYDQSDAAVTFKRVDFKTGEERHIYHGNDGTSMPWNDTAQLNYLNPETREAVIQTILHIARNFPVIRFDAAMTLAKKHIQRLWFPEPGAGGDIPTRSEKGLSRADFNKAIPIEFWREVVDRIKDEAPETLLLAEAFWMMEGYFVKNLGMHRVYNSAFMNMLKMEENQKYRETIKNTLSFDPEILKRFVNFMNNPDEDTAAEQFGMGDKYFGICTMLSTMPGLPMFGHGQIEGFKEKYGMEYRKACYDEVPDINFIERHSREIFPLLKKRYLFSESKNFNLYDLHTQNGHVNENVFAWSNSNNREFAIVFYNNNFHTAEGWIHTAARKKDQSNINIGSALHMNNSSKHYCIFTEERSRLTYIRESRNIYTNGLFIHLNGYECQVFMDFREVEDKTGDWGRLTEKLNGNGVINIERALRKLKLNNASYSLLNIFCKDTTDNIKKLILKENPSSDDFLHSIQDQYIDFLEKLETVIPFEENKKEEIVSFFIKETRHFDYLGEIYRKDKNNSPLWLKYIFRGFEMMPEVWTMLLAWLTFYPLSILLNKEGNDDLLFNSDLAILLEDLDIGNAVNKSLKNAEIEEKDHRELLILAILISSHNKLKNNIFSNDITYSTLLKKYIDQNLVADFIGKNNYKNIEWFKREAFQLFNWWIITLEALKISPDQIDLSYMNNIFEMIQSWQKGEENSDCQIQKLINNVREL